MHNKLVEAALAWRHADMKSALIYLEEIDGDPDEAREALLIAERDLRIEADRVKKSCRRTRTFEVSYNYFDQGTVVTPTSTRCPLAIGQNYVITECHEPMFADDKAICFVEGHKTGITTEYLRAVR
jgi:hypothetical protein